MKVSDYIVSFFDTCGIRDAFGYPGGMVTHLMDSFDTTTGNIRAHVSYHEQAAAFEACGYAQASQRPGLAYATSGPGATNLITGIANAYFDSIPVVFITGQVNTYESKKNIPIRQRGFQEMDVIGVVASITKYSVQITDEVDIRYCLEKALWLATEGRPGPVVLDIPMNVQRAEINPEALRQYVPEPAAEEPVFATATNDMLDALQAAKRPCIVAGAGIQSSGMVDCFRQIIERMQIPVVSSMPAVDVLPNSPYYYGFIGAYGMRYANWILAKSDLIISLGSRLDLRQIGIQRKDFAPQAKLIRIEIDPAEIAYSVKEDEHSYRADLRHFLPYLLKRMPDVPSHPVDGWLEICRDLKNQLFGLDLTPANKMMENISGLIEQDAVITTDVGQNQVWVAQSFKTKGQRILFSAGHGAMGYSLPAAIGAHYGSGKKVYSFNGDGGLQMNLQELQFLVRENLPVKVVLFNNHSLGMIRHFQEMYFNQNYAQTKESKGYTTPDFAALANAYQLPYVCVKEENDLVRAAALFAAVGPAFVEIELDDTTFVFPKSSVNNPLWMQEPPLDAQLLKQIEQL